MNECRINKNSFVLDKDVHGEQYSLSKYKGGIIVFSTNVNDDKLCDNKLVNRIKQMIVTFNNRLSRGKKLYNRNSKSYENIENKGDRIDAYSIGNFFKGKYVGDNGEMYDEQSIAVDVNGISSKYLLDFVELLAYELMQETVLAKDLNTNKIYTADPIPVSQKTNTTKNMKKNSHYFDFLQKPCNFAINNNLYTPYIYENNL